MASFSIDEFVGNGVLKGLLPKLLEEGWDDVPTLKIMDSEDMNALNMTQQEKNAVEIRSYLHDRSLMQYGDKLESDGRSLPEILGLSIEDLSSQFGMKRGHIARFMDRKNPCEDPLPKPYAGGTSTASRYNSPQKRFLPLSSGKDQTIRKSFARRSTFDGSVEQSIADFKIKDGHIFKGIVAYHPAEARACGCVQPPPGIENVAPYSSIQNISVQKLTPEYKIGMERLVKNKAPPLKASELWRDQPAVVFCIRRPGCIMCRAEAHQLYAKKPIFDALGVRLVAVIHEHIEAEVKDFWPRYWGGVVLHDRNLGFFKALGGGKLLKEKFLSGFIFNPRAIANYKRAKAMRISQNLRGEGEIKGGLFIVGAGNSGIAYQFIERNFGDWAPVPEVIDICTKLQNHQPDQGESMSTLREDE